MSETGVVRGAERTVAPYETPQLVVHGTIADLTRGQGAGLGAIAGLIGAFVGVVVFAATSFISMPLFARLAEYFQVEGDLPFRTDPGAVLASTFAFFLLNLVAYPLFGALSGLVGASLLRKPPEAAASNEGQIES